MKLILLQIDKKTMFLKVFKYPINGFYINLAGIFGLDQDVIQIYNDKNIEFFS